MRLKPDVTPLQRFFLKASVRYETIENIAESLKLGRICSNLRVMVLGKYLPPSEISSDFVECTLVRRKLSLEIGVISVEDGAYEENACESSGNFDQPRGE